MDPDLERDLADLRAAVRDVLDLTRRRALVGWDYDSFYKGGVLYLVDLARRAKREHAPDLAVLLAFSKAALVLGRAYAREAGDEPHPALLARAVNDVNRAIVAVEKAEPTSYLALVEALDGALPEHRAPLAGLVDLLRAYTVAAADRAAEAAALERARRDVLLVLAHVQFALGVVLRWDLVALERVRERGEALGEARDKYVRPVLDALSPLERWLGGP